MRSDGAAAGERERDLDRFLTFVDAVAAIAITLLVLPLVELPAQVDDGGSVTALLRDHADELWAFFLSFAVGTRFWFVQHQAVRRMLGYDSRVAGLLMLFTLTLVFLPFSTGLVAASGDSPLTKVLYIGTMVISTLSIAGVQLVLERRPELTDGTHGDPLTGLANALMLMIALTITLLVPATSYLPLLLLVFGDRLADGWRWLGKRRRD